MLYQVSSKDGSSCLVNDASNALEAIGGAEEGWGVDPQDVIEVMRLHIN